MGEFAVIYYPASSMFISYEESRFAERSFLIPLAISLVIIAIGGLLVTLSWGLQLPPTYVPGESEVDQFGTLWRVEAAGMLILAIALFRKTFLSEYDVLMVMWREVFNSLATMLQMCCATAGLINGLLYVLNLSILKFEFAEAPLPFFPSLPLFFLGIGFYLGLCRTQHDTAS